MNIIFLIIAGVAGVVLGVYFGKGNDIPFRLPTKRKQEKLERILTLFIDADKITNKDVQELLKVSDSTATRYLDDLEERGRIEQIGETGQSVFYRLTEASS